MRKGQDSFKLCLKIFLPFKGEDENVTDFPLHSFGNDGAVFDPIDSPNDSSKYSLVLCDLRTEQKYLSLKLVMLI